MKRSHTAYAMLCLLLMAHVYLHTQTHPAVFQDTTAFEQWSSHFQFTSVLQNYSAFSAPYTGTNSLQPRPSGNAMTVTSTLFLGARINKYIEVFWNPEIAGGGGINSVVGIAGFANGEAVRVGDPKPSLYTARAFVRAHIPLGTEQERVEDDANQLAGLIAQSRITMTLGKINLLDIFDENDQLSFDPRTQFLNWSLMAPGGWDFSADTRGYTYGVVAELHQPTWRANIGWTMLPNDANGAVMDMNLAQAYTLNAEFVKPYSLWNKRGHLHLIAFLNRARMGNFDKAVADAMRTATLPDITLQRDTYRQKYGFALTATQDLTEHIGSFLRASWNNGANETWMFTQIDRSLAIGGQFVGALWNRPFDAAGIAGVVNGISSAHQQYLSAGGIGFMIGDGRLRYAPEMILETYYSFCLARGLFVSPNYQLVVNPGYNADRSGPIHLFALRIHAEFGEPR